MSFLVATKRAWREFRSSLANPDRWLLRAMGANDTWAGEDITEHNATEIPAVLSCVQVLAQTGGCIPLFVYRRLVDGGKEKAPDHPVYYLIHDEPNPEQTPYEFKEMMISHVCLWGNFYGQLVMDGKGAVRQIWPLRPDWMSVERPRPDGPKIYRYRRPDGMRVFLEDEILHVAGLPSAVDPLKGLSPIGAQRELLASDKAAQKMAAKLWKNGVKPSGILQIPPSFSEKARKNLEESFNSQYSASQNAHKALMLEDGVKWVQTTIPPEDAQFLETRKHTRSEICGLFRVPPHFIGDLDRATNNNIENQDLSLAKHTMNPWCTRIQQRMSKSLFGVRERLTYFCEFDMNALMRGDAKSRAEFYNMGINGSWLEINDIRAWENLNPWPAGYVTARPLNTAWVDRDGNIVMNAQTQRPQ